METLQSVWSLVTNDQMPAEDGGTGRVECRSKDMTGGSGAPKEPGWIDLGMRSVDGKDKPSHVFVYGTGSGDNWLAKNEHGGGCLERDLSDGIHRRGGGDGRGDGPDVSASIAMQQDLDNSSESEKFEDAHDDQPGFESHVAGMIDLHAGDATGVGQDMSASEATVTIVQQEHLEKQIMGAAPSWHSLNQLKEMAPGIVPTAKTSTPQHHSANSEVSSEASPSPPNQQQQQQPQHMKSRVLAKGDL